MKRILLASFVACSLFSSCGSNSAPEVYVDRDSLGNVIPFHPIQAKQQTVQPAPVQQTTPGVQPMTAAQQQQQSIQQQIQQQMQQQQAKQAAVNQAMAAQAQNALPTAKGMNPPHGQPGHRCDIPVGAPLNSKPTVTQQQVQPTPANTTTVTQQPVVTAPGMNPPHGQPGHRCEIAVGAPLSSAPPLKTAVTPTATPVVTEPAKKDSGQ